MEPYVKLCRWLGLKQRPVLAAVTVQWLGYKSSTKTGAVPKGNRNFRFFFTKECKILCSEHFACFGIVLTPKGGILGNFEFLKILIGLGLFDVFSGPWGPGQNLRTVLGWSSLDLYLDWLNRVVWVEGLVFRELLNCL